MGGGGVVVGGMVEAVAFAFEAGFSEIAEGVEDAGISTRLGGDLVFEGGGVEVEEQTVHLGNGDTQAGSVQQRSIGLANDIVGEVETRSHFLEPGLVLEPILVAASMPAGEIVGVELITTAAEFFGNRGVGFPIEEHAIDEIAEVAGETGNLAGAAVWGLDRSGVNRGWRLQGGGRGA